MESPKFALKKIEKSRYGLESHKDLTPLPLATAQSNRAFKAAGIPEEVTKRFAANKEIIAGLLGADIYHPSYAYYLVHCWANHYGAVVTAEMFWFSALVTFARMVSKDADLYREFFVDFPERKCLDVYCPVGDLAVQAFIDKALPLIKLDLMPVFSTETPMSKLAKGIAFCDAVSPYLYGMICCCGIPSVTVADTIEDWIELKNFSGDLAEKLKDTPAGSFFGRLSARAHAIEGAIATNEGSIFQGMFELRNCSSGSPVYAIEGWIGELFCSATSNREYLLKTVAENCAKAVFEVEDSIPIEFYAGIFGSRYNAEENILVPHFDRFIAQ